MSTKIGASVEGILLRTVDKELGDAVRWEVWGRVPDALYLGTARRVWDRLWEEGWVEMGSKCHSKVQAL